MITGILIGIAIGVIGMFIVAHVYARVKRSEWYVHHCHLPRLRAAWARMAGIEPMRRGETHSAFVQRVSEAMLFRDGARPVVVQRVDVADLEGDR